MGMSASQGRLLMMTARLSNNEFEQQCVAYSKQRLADDSQAANDQYLDALQETQYQILTGYQGDTAQYNMVSYNTLTGFNNVGTGKQYIVSDAKGQIIVTKGIEQAFKDANHNFNSFLEKVEPGTAYTQVADTDITEGMVHDAWDRYFTSINKGHKNGIYADEGSRHILGFSYNEHSPDKNGNPYPVADYVTYNTATYTSSTGEKIYLQKDSDDNFFYTNYKVEVESYIDENGETQYSAYFYATETAASGTDNDKGLQQDTDKYYLNTVKVVPSGDGTYKFYNLKEEADGTITEELIISEPGTGNIYINRDTANLYDGVFKTTDQATTEVSPENTVQGDQAIFFEGATAEQRDLYDYAMAISKKYAFQYKNGSSLVYDPDKLQYYKNIYNQMTTHGYTTYEKMVETDYITPTTFKSDRATTTDALSSYDWLVNNVKNGKLTLAFYSSTEKAFIKTTLDDDESIVNKENKQKMAIAEQVYQNHMDHLEAEDKKFDMQLTKLESEHSALQTEYDAVAKVISKNVEKSFGIFNA